VAIINAKPTSSRPETELDVLPTDTYHMKVASADYEENPFDKNDDGSPKMQITLKWVVSRVTPDQDEAGVVPDMAIWTHHNPYYNTVKGGAPSKFMEFIDNLREQGHFQDFDPEAIDTDDFVGIEQRCSVVAYTKTKGANAGLPGNKIVAFMPLKPRKPQPKVQAAQPRPGAVVARNVPQPIEEEEVDPFAVSA
jgi:hypothetical protein